MKHLFAGLVAFFLTAPGAFADSHECICDHACQEKCEKGGGNKDCKCTCGCAKTGKCKHGKCAHHDHGADKKEEKK